jgi:hypothetical protein
MTSQLLTSVVSNVVGHLAPTVLSCGVGVYVLKQAGLFPVVRNALVSATMKGTSEDYGTAKVASESFSLLRTVFGGGAARITAGTNEKLTKEEVVLVNTAVAREKEKTSSLPPFCVDLSSKVLEDYRAGSALPFFGREDIENVLVANLAKIDAGSAILQGESGRGKTALVNNIVLKAMLDTEHPLHDYKFVRLVIKDIMPDKKGFGEQCKAFFNGGVECSFAQVIRSINSTGNVILVIDELQELMLGHQALFNDFKTILGENRVKIIGTTTNKALLDQVYIQSPDLKRRIARIVLPEMTLEEASLIIQKSLEAERVIVRVEGEEPSSLLRGSSSPISPSDLRGKLAKAICYFSSEFPGNFPAKAVNFLQELRTFKMLRKGSAGGVSCSDVVDYYMSCQTVGTIATTTNRSKEELLGAFSAQNLDVEAMNRFFKSFCINYKEERPFTLGNQFIFSSLPGDIAKQMSDAEIASRSFFISNSSSVFEGDLCSALSDRCLRSMDVHVIQVAELAKIYRGNASTVEKRHFLSRLESLLQKAERNSNFVLIFSHCDALNINGALFDDSETYRSGDTGNREESPTLGGISELAGQAINGMVGGEIISEGTVSGAIDGVLRAIPGRTMPVVNRRLLPEALEPLKEFLLKAVKSAANVVFCSEGEASQPAGARGSLVDAKLRHSDILKILTSLASGLEEEPVGLAQNIFYYGIYHGGHNFTADSAIKIFSQITGSEESFEMELIEDAYVPELTETYVETYTKKFFNSEKEILGRKVEDLGISSRQDLSLDDSSGLNVVKGPGTAIFSRAFSLLWEALRGDVKSKIYRIQELSSTRSMAFFKFLEGQFFNLCRGSAQIHSFDFDRVLALPFTPEVKSLLLEEELERLFQESKESGEELIVLAPPNKKFSDVISRKFDSLVVEVEGANVKLILCGKLETAKKEAPRREGSGNISIVDIALQACQTAGLPGPVGDLIKKTVPFFTGSTDSSSVYSKEKEDLKTGVLHLPPVNKEELKLLIQREKGEVKWPLLLDLYIYLITENNYSIEDVLSIESHVMSMGSSEEAVEFLCEDSRLSIDEEDIRYYCSMASFYTIFKKKVTPVLGYVEKNWASIIWKTTYVVSGLLTLGYSIRRCQKFFSE